MEKILVIVESPNKAKKIKEYLPSEYTVLASFGHIQDLAKGGSFGIGIDVNNNFKPRYILSDDKVKVLDAIINEAKKSSKILLASDKDREGEYIALSLYERLIDIGVPIFRITFNEIKKAAIIKAIENAGDIDMNAANAQIGRRCLDRVVGFLSSPFLQRSMSQNLSSGRVQSVVTRLVIDREKEIQSFISEDFWTISLKLSKDNQIFQAKFDGKLNDEKSAKLTYDKLNNNFVVVNVIEKLEKKNPFPPLITSTLQQIMSKTYSVSPDRTMAAAQALFENSKISYHRTDSFSIGVEPLNDVRKFIKDNNYILPKNPNVYKNSENSQNAHECIRPTDVLSKTIALDDYSISDPDQKLVYEVIWKYFVSSQMMPAEYNTLKVILSPENDSSIKITASGKALKSKGFLEVLGISDDSKIDIPNLVVGDKVQLINTPNLEKKQTQPPGRWSEANLLKKLADCGIGRPSTYAELLSKITSRNYVEKKGNVYHATELGRQVTEKLQKYFTFMDYDYTAKLEKQLDEIELGKLDRIDMMKDFYSKFKKEIDHSYVDNGFSLCEKCSSPMVKRKRKNSEEEFLGCSNFPKCLNVK